MICAFCGEPVDESAIDPCALVVITGWAGPEDAQSEQQFFSHAECLRARLHPDVAVHAEVLDPAGGPQR